MIVLWRVTERCNYSCGFCAYDRRLPGARRQVDASQVRRLGRLLGEHRRESGDRVLLSWLGGEPLLWPPVFETSAWLRHEHDIDISATTNGSTLHLPRVVRSIVDTFSELTLSVDGLAAFHDQVRGCPGGWQRLRAAVQALREARQAAGSTLKLRINTVLMRDNLGQFPSLCAELADWGVDEVTFNQLGGRDRPEFFPDHGLRPADVEALRALLPGLRASLAGRHVRLCGSAHYLDRLQASAEQRPLAIGECSPGERFLFIDESGRVAPCSFTGEDYGVDMDELRDSRDLLDLPSRYRAARATSRATACGDCPSNHMFAKFSV